MALWAWTILAYLVGMAAIIFCTIKFFSNSNLLRIYYWLGVAAVLFYCVVTALSLPMDKSISSLLQFLVTVQIVFGLIFAAFRTRSEWKNAPAMELHDAQLEYANRRLQESQEECEFLDQLAADFDAQISELEQENSFLNREIWELRSKYNIPTDHIQLDYDPEPWYVQEQTIQEELGKAERKKRWVYSKLLLTSDDERIVDLIVKGRLSEDAINPNSPTSQQILSAVSVSKKCRNLMQRLHDCRKERSEVIP